MIRAYCLLLLAAGAAACKTSEPRPKEEPVKGPASATVHPHAAVMERHAIFADQIRESITRGDLEHAHRDARRLAAMEAPADSADYAIRMQRMKEASTRIAGAGTVKDAALAYGELTKACASCHARLGGPAWVDVSGTPPGPLDSHWAMTKHAWAMVQMYNGLVYNSEPPWNAGAELLANRALWADELLPGKTPTRDVDAIASSLRALGHRAVATSDADLRADIYGQILATCAGCHERTSGGPPERWRQ